MANAELRRNLTFEQAEGAAPLPQQLRPREISQELRAKLWRTIVYSIPVDEQTYHGEDMILSPWREILEDMHVDHYHLMVDDFDPAARTQLRFLRNVIEKGNYVHIFGLLQWLIRDERTGDQFVREVDAVLQGSRAAYRVVGGDTIAPVSSEEDRTTVERAFSDLEAGEFRGARSHLEAAATSATEGDFAGSIRESIHAVESVARVLGSTGELSRALTELEKSAIHAALKKGFTAIYGFTSDEEGIRHPLLDDGTANVDETDALFMLGACSAFVSYLINKGRKAGLVR
jgi:hypothetical protein